MINLSELDDNCLIICPVSKKELVLKEMSSFNFRMHMKFLSKEELLKNFTYDYDYETINYVHNKYGFSYENAQELLENLRNISPINEKLANICKIKDDLDDHALLSKNEYFKNLFVNKTVYIYGYSDLDVEIKDILSKNGIVFSYLQEDKTNAFHHEVIKFHSLEDEVVYVFNKIGKLIDNGVNLNNIYIYNYSLDYDLLIEKMNYFYNFPIEKKDSFYLYESPIYKEFIIALENNDVKNAFEIVKKKNNNDPFDALGKLISCITNIFYLNLKKSEFIEFLNYLAKNTPLKKEKYKESIKIIDGSFVANNDKDYVFILGFSLDSYPVIHKDIGFYNDEENSKLNLLTSKIKNKIEENDIINFLNNSKNLIITYKEKSDKIVFYPSLLINILGMDIIDFKEEEVFYSKSLAEILNGKFKDAYKLYGIGNKYLDSFTDEEIKYSSFKHTFSKIPLYKDEKYHEFSYTKIDQYNKCAFSYYVANILKCNDYEEIFVAKFGELMHKILEESIHKTIVSLDEYKEYIDEKFPLKKEKFFVSCLAPQVFDVIKNNEGFLLKTSFKDIQTELKLSINIDDKTKLIGFIDKVLIDKENKWTAIVDYKTGNFIFDLRLVPFGQNLQLPIYSILLNEKYKEYKNIGVFIQHILINPTKKNVEDDTSPYKLCGIFLDDPSIMSHFDQTVDEKVDDNYVNAKYVDKLRKLKNGSIKSTNNSVLNDIIFDDVRNETNKQIRLSIDNIRNGVFDINPKKIKEAKPCDYCTFKDICFRKNTDYIILKKNGITEYDEVENEENDDEI